MPLQGTGCCLSLCNNWRQSLPCTQSYFNAEPSIAEQTASFNATQLCGCAFTVKLYILHSILRQSCQLPTNPTSCCFLFKSHHMSQLVLPFKLFFTACLWLCTSLSRFWCNVANPPKLQACLKITAFHQVWFRIRKCNVALSWCGCQDGILLMYAAIIWISVLGTRNNDTCQHYRQTLRKTNVLTGADQKVLGLRKVTAYKIKWEPCDDCASFTALYGLCCSLQVSASFVIAYSYLINRQSAMAFFFKVINRKSDNFYHIILQASTGSREKKK